MPYNVTLSPLDLGGFIGLGPALSGTFANVAPSPATDTATATAADNFTLPFMMATPPPPGSATLHVVNSGPTGDLFRSGYVTGLPPSPGTLTVISIPTTFTRLSATEIAAMAAGIGTIPLTPPTWLVGLISTLSAGMYIPMGGSIVSIVPTLNTPPGSVTFTVTGFFTFRAYYFSTDTITFTGTLVSTPTPSGDASKPSRILNVPIAANLSTTTTGPSPTIALAGLFFSLLAPILGAMLQPQIEAVINREIDGRVAPALASLGFLRSPSSVVSARRVVITGSGISLALVIADLYGPAISLIPKNLRAAVSPAPQAGSQRVYTVTVTDTTTGTPINQAAVVLHNFTTNGTAQTLGPLQTNTNGQVTFNAALHPKITFKVIPETRERVRIFAPPTLTVSKRGFTTINLRLLEDSGDV